MISKFDSRTILGEQGSEQLLGQGDMLYMQGGGRIGRVHGPFVSDKEVEDVVAFLREQGEPSYLEEVTEVQDDDDGPAMTGIAGASDGEKGLFDQAVAVVSREGKASTSFIQRHLSIGYNRAAKLIEQMEKEGIVSPANHGRQTRGAGQTNGGLTGWISRSAAASPTRSMRPQPSCSTLKRPSSPARPSAPKACRPRLRSSPTPSRRRRRATATPVSSCRRGAFRLDYRAEITLNPLVHDPASVGEFLPQELPLTVLPHLYASRYCQSDKLSRFATRQFESFVSGYQRVTAICNWIYSNVDYISGSTDEMTSAFDTVTQRAGVCRDFAHLGIALCRANGIPARYVSAYAWRLMPPDFHAVFEAYLNGPDGGAWYLFDPTRMSAVDGLVRIGVGRDAADVAFCSIFGEAEYNIPHVWISGPDTGLPVTTAAISLQEP